mmetsp:Transcript_36877/g.57673  ORF Transcript_36877/g.57673 Transcript_36877/m.57673 type:complete len:110 (+) Transcript_36877:1054-1383(+)
MPRLECAAGPEMAESAIRRDLKLQPVVATEVPCLGKIQELLRELHTMLRGAQKRPTEHLQQELAAATLCIGFSPALEEVLWNPRTLHRRACCTAGLEVCGGTFANLWIS